MASHPVLSDDQARAEALLQIASTEKWLRETKERDPAVFAAREKDMLDSIASFKRKINFIDNPPKVWPGMFHFIGPLERGW